MKKVGLVTMYDNNNYGSCLQCLATIKILHELGYEPVVINRMDKSIVKQTIRLLRKFQFLYRIVLNPEKGNRFRLSISESRRGYNDISIESKNLISKFIKEYIPKENYAYSQLKRKARSDEFLAFISGSDQIWNVSAPYLNPILYLEFAPNYKRIAFAPSFGIDRIPNYEKKELSKKINKYLFLSVREETGREIIKELTAREVPVILDPTLLVEKKKWIEFSEVSTKIEKKYILVYFLNSPSKLAIEVVKKVKYQSKLELIILPYKFDDYNDLEVYKFYTAGPKEFVGLINNAEFIITDSFHGVAFSINFNKQFYVVERDYGKNIKQNGRILSLVNKCGLESRFLKKYDTNISNFNLINYEKTNIILENERKKAKKYLLDALGNIEKNYTGK